MSLTAPEDRDLLGGADHSDDDRVRPPPSESEGRAPSPERFADIPFSQCVEWVYQQFPDKCTRPTATNSVQSETSLALEGQLEQTEYQPATLPLSAMVTSVQGKVSSEVCGKGPGQPPMRMNRYPWFRYPGKPYRTHATDQRVNFPELDTDADTVDQDRDGFKNTTIDNKHLSRLGEGYALSLRIFSSIDWFLATTVSEMRSAHPDSQKIFRLMQVVNKALSHVTEQTTRSRAALLLLQRDAFLRRNSIVLPTELRQEVRAAPIDAPSLFAGTLTSIANRASEAKQRERLIFDTPRSKPHTNFKQSPVSSKSPVTNISRGSQRGRGRGRQTSRGRGRGKPQWSVTNKDSKPGPPSERGASGFAQHS